MHSISPCVSPQTTPTSPGYVITTEGRNKPDPKWNYIQVKDSVDLFCRLQSLPEEFRSKSPRPSVMLIGLVWMGKKTGAYPIDLMYFAKQLTKLGHAVLAPAGETVLPPTRERESDMVRYPAIEHGVYIVEVVDRHGRVCSYSTDRVSRVIRVVQDEIDDDGVPVWSTMAATLAVGLIARCILDVAEKVDGSGRFSATDALETLQEMVGRYRFLNVNEFWKQEGLEENIKKAIECRLQTKRL